MKSILIILMSLLAAGCSAFQAGKSAKGVIEAQKGGEAEGAGAKMVSPNNASGPSVQIAEKRAAYFPPPKPVVAAEPPPIIHVPVGPEEVKALTEAAKPTYEPTVPPPAQPAWLYERTETHLGAHQNAGDLMKSFAELTKGFGGSLILGILMVAGGATWAALSFGNPDGYLWAGIGLFLCGVVCIAINGSIWWSLIGIAPLGFALGQKTGILKFPGI